MINLIKIWQTPRTELIDIIKNLNNILLEDTNEEIKSDFNNGIFRYIHIIASLLLYEILDDISKKIVSNPKFILCEYNLWEGIKDIGFDNFLDENNIDIENPFYEYIIENFKLENPKFKDTNEYIIFLYILKEYSSSYDVFGFEISKKLKDKNFKLYCLYCLNDDLLEKFNLLFNYNIKYYNQSIQDRIKLIETSKRNIIVTFLKLNNINLESDIFLVINILEKYNWEEIKLIDKYTSNYQDDEQLKLLSIIGTIDKGLIYNILNIYDNFINIVKDNFIIKNIYKIILLKFVIALYKFKTPDEMFSIFKFILTFIPILNNIIENRHINLISIFLGTFRDFFSCKIPGIKQYNINLKNKLRYLTMIMPEDLILRKRCKEQFKILMKFSFINNLEIVLKQFKILLFDERTDLSKIEHNIMHDCLIILIYSNKICNFNIRQLIHFNNLDFYKFYNIGYYNPFSKIAKILLFCKQYTYNIENTVKFKVYLLNESTSVSYLTSIYKLNIRENNININIRDAYALGLDVHNGTRDNKTLNIIYRLIQLYPLENNEIDTYFDNFWEYKNNFNESKLNILYRVLGVNKDLDEILNVNSEYYNGFLSYTYLIKGKIYSARHIIAVFWKFASEFVDPICLTNKIRDEDCIERDRENIKLGIFEGLMDALISGNRLICPPGKLQRLAAATIQGRIKDENDKFLYIDEDLENDVIVPQENGYITNLREIHKYLRRFEKFLEQSNRPKNIEDFFEELFISLENLNVKLNYSYVIYYVTMMTENIDGLIIEPELSLISNYDDNTFQINDYISKFLEQEKIDYDLANPQIVEARERRRLQNLENAERNRNRINALFARRENNERNKMEEEDVKKM